MFENKKPTKTQTDLDLDGLDDILNPKGNDFPIAGFDDDDEADKADKSGDGFADLPRSSSANTRDKVSKISPSDQMRDYMNRINPNVGADEPELPNDEVVVRTAQDVPAVINTAMRATGFQTPEWHSIKDLPGYSERNIRGMGRQMFGMFTSTPLENILTMANVNGQGPNTDAEMRAVASWLKNNADDLGEVSVSHGMAIPGYEPDVREFSINGVRFHVVRDPMGQYIYAYPDKDARIPAGNKPQQKRLKEMIEIYKPTLLESIRWDEELEEAFIEESSLSKLLGKMKGGQNLVRWLHRRHRLSNDADFEPAPFNKEVLWKQFKSNPDDFVIVSAENGVAGIKPDEKFIKNRTAEFAKKGKQYNPANDATVPYQIVAFTDDGEQIDPELLRPADDKDAYRDPRDPTVTNARMGKHTGRDMQNPNNVFNLLADQIGRLRTVWISGFSGYRGDPDSVRDARGSIERDKMAKRAEYKKGAPEMSENEALQAILKRVRPVLKTLGNQALSQINRTAKRYVDGGNFEAGQRVMASGKKLKDVLVSLDTDRDISLDTAYGSPTRTLAQAIIGATQAASGSKKGTEEFKQWLNDAARGSTPALRPILDGLRDTLVNIQDV